MARETGHDRIQHQQRALNEAYTYISALQAQIRAMQDYIGQLQSRVRYLQGRVAYWRGQASYWKGQAIHWKGRATGYELRSYAYHLYGDKFGFSAPYINVVIARFASTSVSIDFVMDSVAGKDEYENSRRTSERENLNDGSAPEGDNWDFGDMFESAAKDATLGAAFGCGTGAVAGGGAGCVPGAISGGALGAAQSVIHYAWDQWG